MATTKKKAKPKAELPPAPEETDINPVPNELPPAPDGFDASNPESSEIAPKDPFAGNKSPLLIVFTRFEAYRSRQYQPGDKLILKDVSEFTGYSMQWVNKNPEVRKKKGAAGSWRRAMSEA